MNIMFCQRVFRSFLKRKSALIALTFLALMAFLIRSDYSDSFTASLRSRMQGPLLATDENLIKEVREKFLVPPSKHPYNLEIMKKNGTALIGYNYYRHNHKGWIHINKFLKKIYPPNERSHGFFIEAGALDGEFISNSLYLETELGWNGLLIEPDKDMVQDLRSKNRKAWSCHCCLSGSSYPYTDVLSKVLYLPIRGPSVPALSRGINTMMNNRNAEDRLFYGYSLYEPVQCLPIQTMLLAINVSKVDLFSLDIEGAELPVLKSFPWDTVTVDVWIVEHHDPKAHFLGSDEIDKSFIELFTSKGYDVYNVSTYFPRDYTFIRKNSTVHDKVYKARAHKL